LAKNGPKLGRRYYEKEEMVLQSAMVAGPCWNGPEMALLVVVVVAYPPAGTAYILLLQIVMVKSF